MLVKSVTSLGMRACILFHSGFSTTSATALKHQHPYAQLQASHKQLSELLKSGNAEFFQYPLPMGLTFITLVIRGSHNFIIAILNVLIT